MGDVLRQDRVSLKANKQSKCLGKKSENIGAFGAADLVALIERFGKVKEDWRPWSQVREV